jgi:hypothetical protein
MIHSDYEATATSLITLMVTSLDNGICDLPRAKTPQSAASRRKVASCDRRHAPANRQVVKPLARPMVAISPPGSNDAHGTSRVG